MGEWRRQVELMASQEQRVERMNDENNKMNPEKQQKQSPARVWSQRKREYAAAAKMVQTTSNRTSAKDGRQRRKFPT